MASKKISELSACTSPVANTDWVVMVANSGSNTQKCTVADFFTNSDSNAIFSEIVGNTVTANVVIATDNTTPTANNDTVTQGRIWFDDNYLYVAIANNLIRRITLETF